MTHEQGISQLKRTHRCNSQSDSWVMAVDRVKRSTVTNKQRSCAAVSFCVLSAYALQILAGKESMLLRILWLVISLYPINRS